MRLKPEQVEIRELARSFAERYLGPRAAEAEAMREIPADLYRELAQTGFLGMLVPEEAHGLELDLTSYLLVLAEFARKDPAVAVAVGAHNGPATCALRRHGTAEQRERWLPRLASGEVMGAFALAEPQAGSDAASLSATAERAGNGWLLRGRKRWVTNGARAGLAVVFARTPAEGVTAFLIDPGQGGYTVLKRENTLGLRALEVVEVELEGISAGPQDVLGPPGRGLAVALGAIDVGRVGIAAIATGIGRAAEGHARRYALEREQFGRPIADFGAIQAKFAEMATRLQAAELLWLDAGRSLQDAGVLDLVEGVAGPSRGDAPSRATAKAAMAKLAASESATWVADAAVQVFGGYGYMRHYPVERRLRDARGTELLGGSSEILRHVIARPAHQGGAARSAADQITLKNRLQARG